MIQRLNQHTYSCDRSIEQVSELQECQVVTAIQHENPNKKERGPMPPSARKLLYSGHTVEPWLLHFLEGGFQMQTGMLLSSQICCSQIYQSFHSMFCFQQVQLQEQRQGQVCGLDWRHPVLYLNDIISIIYISIKENKAVKKGEVISSKRKKHLTIPDSIGIMRKPEGIIGASSENDASKGANISSAHVPTALSSTPLQNCRKMHSQTISLKS